MIERVTVRSDSFLATKDAIFTILKLASDTLDSWIAMMNLFEVFAPAGFPSFQPGPFYCLIAASNLLICFAWRAVWPPATISHSAAVRSPRKG